MHGMCPHSDSELLKYKRDMITFGYRNKFGGLLRAVVAVAIGVVMIVSKTNALELAVRIIAAFLVATGVVSLILGLKNKEAGDSSLMFVNSGVDILLGVLIFVFPGVVANLIVYFVGFALLCFGIFQMITLISAGRTIQIGMASYIMPALVILVGGFLLFNPSFIGDAIGIVAGAALVVYGVSEIFATWKMKKAMKEYDFKAEAKSETEAKIAEEVFEDADIKDVDYEKVDEE